MNFELGQVSVVGSTNHLSYMPWIIRLKLWEWLRTSG